MAMVDPYAVLFFQKMTLAPAPKILLRLGQIVDLHRILAHLLDHGA
jgi:hypothetical protein